VVARTNTVLYIQAARTTARLLARARREALDGERSCSTDDDGCEVRADIAVRAGCGYVKFIWRDGVRRVCQQYAQY
jgi:hypothetical protein